MAEICGPVLQQKQTTEPSELLNVHLAGTTTCHTDTKVSRVDEPGRPRVWKTQHESPGSSVTPPRATHAWALRQGLEAINPREIALSRDDSGLIK